MKRRRLLTLLGAAALPVAGCLDTTESPGTPSSDTTAPSSETATESPSFAVENVGTRRQALTSGVHLDVAAHAGTQFVGFDVTETGTPTHRTRLGSQFAVDLDGTRYPDGYDTVTNTLGVVPRVGVPVPDDVAPDEGAILQVDGDAVVDRWALSEETLTALASPAAFVVESVEVPETAEPASFEASVTVRNEGSGDGVFLAEFGAAVVSDVAEVEFAVPAGESVTHTETIPTEGVESVDGDVLPVVYDDGYSRRRREVTVEAGG
ncbi:hypothetical protein [Halomarina rubra]|uniref:CARDB protein n=1 Tax=Halomarina rubra TaxID=2071873 RepID=A0ABD6AQU8_9EURY|nr:hypothetical protein [Halomarina rubra]